MQADIVPFTLVEDAEGMEEFRKANEGIEWMGFDTEFIGEKRFITLICLIQVATEHGYYLIDPIRLKDLGPLLDMLEDERILKIVHAGDNDYRLFNTHFGIIPKNAFDTQIASAFIGYKYPVSFSKLLESELGITVSKGYTVTDWERRPFRKKQVRYALDDVIHLYDLWKSLKRKLEKAGRYEWAMTELKRLEDPNLYEQDPYKEALKSNLIRSLRKKEKVFLLRMFLWRTAEAKRLDHSKEMVLPNKFISPIVRAIHSGVDALRHNRRLPNSLVSKFGQQFLEMYQQPATQEENEVLKRIPPDNSDNPKADILIEMLDLLVRYKCLEEGISHHMVMPRSVLKRMKNDKDFFDPSIDTGWRKDFLGAHIVDWFKHRRNLKIVFEDGKFELIMQEQEVESEA
ncbi:MAG TPA: ribonuclease D [Bacteroidetes bacterium]|nr:ribonuclease D [Bacteroidota bacterium]